MKITDVKIGEKYVIKEIGKYSSRVYNDGIWNDDSYKVGEIVEIIEDENSDICLSRNGGDESETIKFILKQINDKDYILELEPYIDPHDELNPPKTILGVLPEGENSSTPYPSGQSVAYAKSYYDNYIKMRKVYLEQFLAINKIICHTEDELNILIADNTDWTDTCVQDKICEILRIEKEDNILDILQECFTEMAEFNVMFNKLQEGGYVI